MSSKIVKQIHDKTGKLLEAKKRYNDLVKSVDDEFSDRISQLNESCVHVPLSLAKQIAQALSEGKTKTTVFKEYIQQLTELLQFIDSDSNSDLLSSSQNVLHEEEEEENNLGEKYIQQHSQNSLSDHSGSSLNVRNGGNQNEEEEEEDLSFSGEDDDDDIAGHLDSIQLDMDQFINQNYDIQEDLDGIGGADD